MIDPTTEEVVNVTGGDKEDVDLAVKASRVAFDHGAWPLMADLERGRIMIKFADLILENVEELETLDAIDAGKVSQDGKASKQDPWRDNKMVHGLQGYMLQEPMDVGTANKAIRISGKETYGCVRYGRR